MRAQRLGLLLATFGISSGCSEYKLDAETDGNAVGVPDSPEFEDGATLLRLDVTPADTVQDAAGERFLPQTFLVDPSTANDLELYPAVTFEGILSAYAVSPYTRNGELPGQQGPIGGALVSIRRVNSLQTRNDVTDTSDSDASFVGGFLLRVVPDLSYTVAYVPEDPALPLRVEPLALATDIDQEVDLGEGLTVWGYVTTDTGAPMVGASVRAMAGEVRGAAARTDANGFWFLRVSPGTWTIECSGRNNGRDPILTSEPLVVDGVNTELDFQYPNLDLWSVGGRVLDSETRPVAGATARFTAVSLDDYDDSASQIVEVQTNSDGNFDTRLVPGEWRVDILPAVSDDLSPISLGTVLVDDPFEDLGVLITPAFTTVTGAVLDPDHLPVAGALVTMTEAGFSKRSWQATTDADGSFDLVVSKTALEVWMSPPVDRPDLAVSVQALSDPSSTDLTAFELSTGYKVSGTLRAPTADGTVGVPFALVEATDEAGHRWGAALTDEEGNYSLRITTPR